MDIDMDRRRISLSMRAAAEDLGLALPESPAREEVEGEEEEGALAPEGTEGASAAEVSPEQTAEVPEAEAEEHEHPHHDESEPHEDVDEEPETDAEETPAVVPMDEQPAEGPREEGYEE
jgi:small subunit ribosomal protein S1